MVFLHLLFVVLGLLIDFLDGILLRWLNRLHLLVADTAAKRCETSLLPEHGCLLEGVLPLDHFLSRMRIICFHLSISCLLRWRLILLLLKTATNFDFETAMLGHFRFFFHFTLDFKVIVVGLCSCC